MTKIKIGINSTCWMNTAFSSMDCSLEQFLSEISLIGYQGVELEDFVHEDLVMDLIILLESRGLSCIGKWYPTYILGNGIEKEIERLKEHLDAISKLKGDVVILVERTGAICQQKGIPLARRPIISEEETWEELCKGLERMACLINEHGMMSAYHHHMGTVVQDKQDIDRLMQGTEALGLLYDTGHLTLAQENLLPILHEYRSRITHVHCQSVSSSALSDTLRGNRSFSSSLENGIFSMLGDREQFGFKESIDFATIIESLMTSDYSGWIVIEGGHMPNKRDPFTYGAIGYEMLHSLMVQGEFRNARF